MLPYHLYAMTNPVGFAKLSSGEDGRQNWEDNNALSIIIFKNQI